MKYFYINYGHETAGFVIIITVSKKKQGNNVNSRRNHNGK
jgi:hypothetical protein